MSEAITPYNPTTGEHYNGGNIAALIEQAAGRGFRSMHFAGFVQWKKAGRQVKKGEKAISVKACGSFEKINKETGAIEKGTFAKGQAVFAYEQTEQAS